MVFENPVAEFHASKTARLEQMIWTHLPFVKFRIGPDARARREPRHQVSVKRSSTSGRVECPTERKSRPQQVGPHVKKKKKIEGKEFESSAQMGQSNAVLNTGRDCKPHMIIKIRLVNFISVICVNNKFRLTVRYTPDKYYSISTLLLWSILPKDGMQLG